MAGHVSGIRTHLGIFVHRHILPYLEAALVWYLRVSGQRNVEQYWRMQLADKPRKKSEQADTSKRPPSTSFEIRLATVRQHGSRTKEISDMVNGAYVRELKDALPDGASDAAEQAFSRTSPVDIERRLLTDAEVEELRSSPSPPLINRVLFLAVTKDDAIVGTCAATLAAPWCPSGVGSWGLLAVSTPQLGVGRVLVEHCEDYIRTAMLGRIRIEYFYIAGLPSSESLRKWYEERQNYVCFKADPSGRSYRGNLVKGEVSFRHCEKAVDIVEDVTDVSRDNQTSLFESRRRRLAKFLLVGVSKCE